MLLLKWLIAHSGLTAGGECGEGEEQGERRGSGVGCGENGEDGEVGVGKGTGSKPVVLPGVVRVILNCLPHLVGYLNELLNAYPDYVYIPPNGPRGVERAELLFQRLLVLDSTVMKGDYCTEDGGSQTHHPKATPKPLSWTDSNANPNPINQNPEPRTPNPDPRSPIPDPRSPIPDP